MSRQQNQGEKYVILQTPRFHELCAVLGLKEQCCSDPNRKTIEKAFRKKALKTHPDKGGDQKEFKKINDAYNRLIGHITKLEITAEESEMSCNSIVIEVSKISLPKWREKLKNKYGIPKCENVKGTLFEGAYKQYRGRSNNTGPITIVMYEDPQDGLPKLVIRSEKYMAWIAEQQLPLHLHVDKGRSIQFDQWRICHLAEFGLTSFSMKPTPATPASQPKRNEDPPKTKEEKAEAKESRKKAKREAAKRKEEEQTGANNEKENSEPQTKEPFSSKIFEEAGKETDDGDEWEEVPEDSDDPFPKLWNMAEQSYVKDGRRYRKKTKNVQKNADIENKPFTCGSCGVGYANLLDYQNHKKSCIPDEDFGQADQADSANDAPVIEKKTDTFNTESTDSHQKEVNNEPPKSKDESTPIPNFNFLTGNNKPKPKPPGAPLFECDGCGAGYDKLVAYTKHKAQCSATANNNDNGGDKPASNNYKPPSNGYKESSNEENTASKGNKAVNNDNKLSDIFDHLTETNKDINIPKTDFKDNANNVEKDCCKSPSPSGCETLTMTHSKERQTIEKHVTQNDGNEGANNSGTKQSEPPKDSLSNECKSAQKLTNDLNATEEIKHPKFTIMQDAHDAEEPVSKETQCDNHVTQSDECVTKNTKYRENDSVSNMNLVTENSEDESEDINNRPISWGGLLVSEDELCADLGLFSQRWPRLDPAVLEVNWQTYREGIKRRRGNSNSATTNA